MLPVMQRKTLVTSDCCRQIKSHATDITPERHVSTQTSVWKLAKFSVRKFRFTKEIGGGGQRSTWPQGLYRCCYVKPINTEKNNRNNNGGSVGKSYFHFHEG